MGKISITHEEAKEIGKAVGKHHQYILQLVSAANRRVKKPRCGIPLAMRIEEASGGRITALFLRPDLKDIAKKVMASL